jgi:hypothetical protein
MRASVIRTQIQLEERQMARLRALSAAEGRSIADLVRRAVDEWVARRGGPDPEARRRRALGAIGLLAGGPPDLAGEHDRYLAEDEGE